MERIINLYYKVLSPSSSEVTEELLSLYSDATNATILFQILKIRKDVDPSIRSLAALGIKQIMQNNIDEFTQAYHSELLQSILFEKDQVIINILLDILQFIIKERRIEGFPDIILFTQSLLNSSMDHEFYLFLIFFNHLAPVLQVDEIIAFYELLQAKLESLIQVKYKKIKNEESDQIDNSNNEKYKEITVININENNRIELLNLYSTLINLIDIDNEKIENCFGFVFTCFKNDLLNDKSKLLKSLLDSMSHFIENDKKCIIDLSEVIKELLELIQNEEIHAQNRYMILELINAIIKKNPDFVQECGQDLITLALILNSQSLNENECFDNQETPLCDNLLQTICKHSSQFDFFHTFIDATQNEYVKSSAGYLSLSSLLEYIPQAINANFGDIMSFILTNTSNQTDETTISAENHLLKESALHLLSSLVEDHFNEMKDYSQDILNTLLTFIQCDHDTLIRESLNTMITFLSSIDISTTFVEEMVSALLNFAENMDKDYSYLVIECIGSLCTAAEDSIVPFSQQIYEFLIARIQDSDISVNSIIKSKSIESLGCLIEFSRQLAEENKDYLLGIINEFIHLEEYKLFSPCTKFLSKLAKSITFDIAPFLDIIEHSLKDQIYKSLDFDLHSDALYLFYSFAKNMEEQIPSLIEVFQPLIESFLDINRDIKINSIKYASKTLIIFAKLQGYVPDSFTNKLIEIIQAFMVSNNEKYSDSAEIAFDSFRNIFEKKIQMNDEILHSFIEFLLNLIHPETVQSTIETNQNSLIPDSDETEELEGTRINMSLLDSAFYSLLSYGEMNIEQFPFDTFWEIINKYNEMDVESDIYLRDCLLSCIGVYSKLFPLMKPQLSSEIIQQLGEIFFSSLPYCDCQLIPQPIVGIKLYIEQELIPTEQQLQSFIDFAEQTFSKEYEGEDFYYQTLSCTSSVMFLIFSKYDIPYEIVSQFLPIIFKFSEKFLFSTEMTKSMYSCAVKVCYKYNDLVSDISANILEFFIRIFMISDQQWNYLKLDDSVISEILDFIAASIKSDSNTFSFYQSLISDELMKERVSIRTRQLINW